uniref:Uncharacterized protein n=1 Tax=Arundo donax TaxID=35708 RepID=A0A0A9HR96_ARUDO
MSLCRGLETEASSLDTNYHRCPITCMIHHENSN